MATDTKREATYPCPYAIFCWIAGQTNCQSCVRPVKLVTCPELVYADMYLDKGVNVSANQKIATMPAMNPSVAPTRFCRPKKSRPDNIPATMAAFPPAMI